MGKKLKAICPHCNKPVQIDVDELALQTPSDGWLVCTPMPVDDSDLNSQN